MEKYSLLTKLAKCTLNIALKLTFSVFLFFFVFWLHFRPPRHCLRPFLERQFFTWLLLQPIIIDWLDISHVPFYWFQSFLRLNSNNQLRDLTRRHFILPHFHPLRSGLKGVREEGKKSGGGGGGAGQRGVLLLSFVTHAMLLCLPSAWKENQ